MDIQNQILQELKGIRAALLSNQTDYCETEEASRIIGLNNTRDLKKLHDQGVLPRYSRGTGYKYKKSDCYKVAALLDNNQITL